LIDPETAVSPENQIPVTFALTFVPDLDAENVISPPRNELLMTLFAFDGTPNAECDEGSYLGVSSRCLKRGPVRPGSSINGLLNCTYLLQGIPSLDKIGLELKGLLVMQDGVLSVTRLL